MYSEAPSAQGYGIGGANVERGYLGGVLSRDVKGQSALYRKEITDPSQVKANRMS